MIYRNNLLRNLVILLCLCFTSSTVAQVKSEWRGIGRTGIYSNESNLLKQWPKKGPELLWYADSIPKGYASVAVANNMVFLTGIVKQMDVVIAYNNKGEKQWETAYGRAWDNSYEHSRCTPTVDGNNIYLSSGIGDVACVNATSGEIIWSNKAVETFVGDPGKFGYSESLLLVGNKVFFTPGGDQTTIVALNKLTGKKIWASKSLNDKPSYTSPKLIEKEGKRQVLNVTENYLFSVNPQDGAILWKFNFGKYAAKRNNQTNTPLFFNNEIYLTSGYDHKSIMLSLNEDWSAVSVKWVDSILDNHHGGVVHIDGYIYGANWLHNRMGNWICLNWDTGKVQYSTEWENKGSIIAADGMLYCYAEKYGNVGIAPINPTKFEIVSTFKVPYGDNPYWAHLVINNGKLYVRSATALMVYNIKKE